MVHTEAGWLFALPGGHGIGLDQTNGYVTLSLRDGGSVYRLAGVEETETVLNVSLGAEITQWTNAYPLPRPTT